MPPLHRCKRSRVESTAFPSTAPLSQARGVSPSQGDAARWSPPRRGPMPRKRNRPCRCNGCTQLRYTRLERLAHTASLPPLAPDTAQRPGCCRGASNQRGDPPKGRTIAPHPLPALPGGNHGRTHPPSPSNPPPYLEALPLHGPLDDLGNHHGPISPRRSDLCPVQRPSQAHDAPALRPAAFHGKPARRGRVSGWRRRGYPPVPWSRYRPGKWGGISSGAE